LQIEGEAAPKQGENQHSEGRQPPSNAVMNTHRWTPSLGFREFY
jgi:hypothetical protein